MRIDDLIEEKKDLENQLQILTGKPIEDYEQAMEIERLERGIQRLDWAIEKEEQSGEKPENRI